MNIQEIREAALAATQGNWIQKDGMRFDPEVVITTQYRAERNMHEICGLDVEFSGSMGVEQRANARHIATASPATVLAMCDEIERLYAKVGAAE